VILTAAAAEVSCSELGTSTDNSAISRQTPVNIKFTPSLTYAEKLLLKKSRRMELPTHGLLNTSRSCDSVLESGRHVLQNSRLDSPARCGADTRSELVLDCNNSNRGICPPECQPTVSHKYVKVK